MGINARIHSLKRPAIERMLLIHNALKKGGFPNCSSLARELEVSSKTISRDIDFMRDRMLMPIDYEPSHHGYCYTREVESLPTIDISEGELLALSIARKSLDHYKGTPFEKPLENAFNKLAASLPDTITANLDDLSETISFRQGRLSRVDESILQTATKAALDKNVLTFDYKKPGAEQTETRKINPYHLTNYLGKWYLIGWDYKREAIRTFLISRFHSATILKKTFTVPDDFSVDEYLWSSFGIYSRSGSHKVVIHFSKCLTEYISENVWHPSQETKITPDGKLEIVFQLGSLIEVSQWILSWGEQAEVQEPKELRDLVLHEAEKVADLYR